MARDLENSIGEQPKVNMKFISVILLSVVFPLFSGINEKNDFLIPPKPNNQLGPRALKPKKNTAFKPGEILTYRLHYGIMDAGVAVLEVKPEIKETAGRKM